MKNIMSLIKKNCLWIILSICIVIFVAIAEDVFSKEIMRMDMIAYNIFIILLRNEYITFFMKLITEFGSSIVLILITLLSFIVIKDKKHSLYIFINLILITLLNNILKYFVQRPRPDGYRLINGNGYSFPSGHSMISMAFYGYIIYLAYKHIKNKTLKYFVILSLTLLITLIGISRIYLGVHYASDVIAGFFISIAYLIIYISILHKSKQIY